MSETPQAPRLRSTLYGLLILGVLLVGSAVAWSALGRLQIPVVRKDLAYTGSNVCSDCHQDRHASWHRTFHRTMTQAADASSVLGRFDGKPLTAFGGQVQPVKTEGGFAFAYSDPASGAALTTLPVLRTVGSHRYQQYLTRDADSETYYRLHYLWHIEDQRWVHMNAAFLGDDAQPFDSQVTTWNTNCVFCHNTGPQPKVSNLDTLRARAKAGEPVDTRAELRFDTKVAELGIGCEACHGPAGEHVARMQRMPLRVMAGWFEGRDSSIVNPERISSQLTNDICGACHAGRTLINTAALDQWIGEGPSFRPGENLSDHLKVLDAKTPSPAAHLPDMFSNRFWNDGSPRLTAYEYQGLRSSACAVDEKMSCIRCHTMHGGNPAGMLPEASLGDAQCVRCHLEVKVKLAAHTGHAPESIGSRCMSCHMPRAVYGVMTIHRTHLIANPDVALDMAAGKPNACLNCHATQSPQWAAAQVGARTFASSVASPTRHDGADPALSDGLTALLAGDPVRQAIAAYELGRVDQAPSHADLLPRVPWLIEALRDDRPAVRRFAWKSLQTIDATLATSTMPLKLASALRGFDFTGEAPAREESRLLIDAAFAAVDKSKWPFPAAATGLDAGYRLGAARLTLLRELGARSDKQIDVGE